MFHYGSRYYFGKISNQMNFQVGTIILAMFAAEDEIGLFDLASQIAVRTMIIPNTLITILIPKVAGDKDGKKELVAQCVRLTGLIYGMLMILLAVFAKPIVAVVFPPAFLPIVPLIRILTIGVVVRSCGKVLVPYFLGTNHPGISSISVAIGAITNVAALWVLLPMIGLSGAAIGMTLGYLASSALLMVAFMRFSGLRAGEAWLPRRSDWGIVANAMKRVRQKILGNR